ncbi:MAG: hypothetical protein MUD14_02025 [Hydrococcus sp. Prado102]|nr:hypothetical protein [Hydrococcus sp. Prado102]
MVRRDRFLIEVASYQRSVKSPDRCSLLRGISTTKIFVTSNLRYLQEKEWISFVANFWTRSDVKNLNCYHFRISPLILTLEIFKLENSGHTSILLAYF